MEWIHQSIWSFVGGVVNIFEDWWILTTPWKFLNFNCSSPNIVHKIKVSWIMVSLLSGKSIKVFTCFLMCPVSTVLCSSNEPVPVRWTNVMVTLPKWHEFLVCHHIWLINTSKWKSSSFGLHISFERQYKFQVVLTNAP